MKRWREYGAVLFESPVGEPQMTEDRIPSEEQKQPTTLFRGRKCAEEVELWKITWTVEQI